MKRAAVITVAGTSSRFSFSLGREVCKAIYSEHSPQDCLLYQQLEMLRPFDLEKIVVVGGYKFTEVQDFLDQQAGHLPITLIYNEHYHDHGSGESLAIGLDNLVTSAPEKPDEIVFLEGDLLFDAESFARIMTSPLSVVSATRDLIRADVSVAFYMSTLGRLCYLYDTEHKQLKVPEPFKILGNSGQVWKFGDTNALETSLRSLTHVGRQGTNLVLIADYFSRLDESKFEFIEFNQWVNCNTVEDYRRAIAIRKAY